MRTIEELLRLEVYPDDGYRTMTDDERYLLEEHVEKALCDWQIKYKPHMLHGELRLYENWHDEVQWKLIQEAYKQNKLWTLTEEDGHTHLNPGVRYVNRKAYIICRVPYVGTPDVLIWEVPTELHYTPEAWAFVDNDGEDD
jgi:hypothetical protein